MLTRGLVLAGFSALVASAGSASAGLAAECRCKTVSRAAAIEATPVVFEARVLRVREEGGFRYAYVEMVAPVKGATPRAMEVATPVAEICGFAVRREARLTVGVSFRENQFWASGCTLQSLNAAVGAPRR